MLHSYRSGYRIFWIPQKVLYYLPPDNNLDYFSTSPPRDNLNYPNGKGF